MIKNYFLLFVFFIFSYNVISQINIPDNNFKNALLNHDPVIDLNDDDEIQVSEAESFKGTLTIRNFRKPDSEKITDLTGIEFFINITKLDCQFNKLTSLDISNNKNLTHIICSTNQINELDLSKNKKLTQLFCGSNQLSSLDVSKNIELTHLSFTQNNISDIDITNNNKLELLECNNNALTDINTSKNVVLKRLRCSSNNLTNIDISLNTQLIELLSNFNQISNIDLSENNKLISLSLEVNNLTNLNIDKNIKLETLRISENPLSKIDLSNNPLLTWLTCRRSKLTDLDVSNNSELTDLYCSFNQIENINLKNGNNQVLINIDLTENPNLTCVEVDDVALANTKTNWLKDPTADYRETCGATASLNEIKEASIKLYPNPVKNTLFIELKNNQFIKQVSLFTISGRKIVETTKSTISCTNLSNGIYLVKIEDSNSKIGIKKFIKY